MGLLGLSVNHSETKLARQVTTNHSYHYVVLMEGNIQGV